MKLLERVTINPSVMHGRPTIRNMRFTVEQMLELLGGGMTPDEILEDYAYIERDDILACLQYAARAVHTKSSIVFA